MKNQTILQKDILELGQQLDSVSGYCLVVYKIGAFKTQLSEGQPYKASFFENTSALEVIGVISPTLNRSFTHKASHFHSDSLHQFSMEYYLDYQILNVKMFADKRIQDPLRLIMDKIKKSIGHQISKIPWNKLFNADAEDFIAIKNHVLNFETTNLNNEIVTTVTDMQSFASGFGIQLQVIDFKFIIPGKYLADKKKIEEVRVNRTIKDEEHKDKVIDKMNEGELKILDAQQDVTEMLKNAAGNVLNTLSSNIDNPDKLVHAIKAGATARQLIKDNFSGNSSETTQNASLLTGNTSALQLGNGQSSSSSSFQGAGQYATLITTLRKSGIGFDSKKAFFATYLQLVAAVMEDNEEKEDELIDELIDMGLPAQLNELIKSRKTFSKEIEMILQ